METKWLKILSWDGFLLFSIIAIEKHGFTLRLEENVKQTEAKGVTCKGLV